MEKKKHLLSESKLSHQIRTTIEEFLNESLKSKLDKLNNDDETKRQRLISEYEIETWIANAAQRVDQIQQVTHALKFSHPKAKGSSLNIKGNQKAKELDIGTHTVANKIQFDIDGNAAVLDVYKFLRLAVHGKSILERAIEKDPDLCEVVSGNKEKAEQILIAFAALTQSRGQPTSHTFAKQIYWPIGNNEYHLLAPLFPTSLTHLTWTAIKEDRFSEVAKAARNARRSGLPHSCGYREYPNMVIQKFGGTKPQNISQLNSERGGETYLLPSLPPSWKSEPIRPPYYITSIFDHLFGSRNRVRELTGILRYFLVKVENVETNFKLRKKRAELTCQIRDELFQFSSEIHELEPGWSLASSCRLNIDEQCWLDPGRGKDDQAFASILRRGEWKDEVCKRFGNWLNARLTTSHTPMGEAEAKHWQTVVFNELRMFRMEIDFND